MRDEAKRAAEIARGYRTWLKSADDLTEVLVAFGEEMTATLRAECAAKDAEIAELTEQVGRFSRYYTNSLADRDRLAAENAELRRDAERLREREHRRMRCCQCDAWVDYTKLQPTSVDPHAPPICNVCLDNAALRKQVEELRKAMAIVADWRGVYDESTLHTTERIAEQFYKDTGCLMPGKDVPALKCSDPWSGFTYRQAEWRVWTEEKNQEINDIIRSALAATEPQLPTEQNDEDKDVFEPEDLYEEGGEG